MYKPPQNTNRVKLIRTKFENVEKNKSPERKTLRYRDRNYLSSNMNEKQRNFREENSQNGKQQLQRQISDPTRRNIKRTPAFRVDKSLDRTSGIQRNGFNSNQSTLYETKVKQFSAVKNNCDKNSNSLLKETSETKPLLVKSKNVPLLIKSYSSLELKCIKKDLDEDIASSASNNCHDITNDSNGDKALDLSMLYTEPIPKALRRNNSNCTDILSSPVTSEDFDPSISNASTLKISDKLAPTRNSDSLTDTLKVALSKPLPKGPAPRKPPRAFQISSIDQSSGVHKNNSFLHCITGEKKSPIPPTKKSLTKSDPKYMLIKLEDALRNNKLRAKGSPKVDRSLTSGEDSDDSLLSRTKSNRTLPRLPNQTGDWEYSDTSAFNFNCLNGFKFAMTNYEKIKEPNSCFFVSNPQEEPVYAEPYHYLIKREGSSRSKQSARNSLYYMSTPLLTAGTFFNTMTESPDKQIKKFSSSDDCLIARTRN